MSDDMREVPGLTAVCGVCNGGGSVFEDAGITVRDKSAGLVPLLWRKTCENCGGKGTVPVTSNIPALFTDWPKVSVEGSLDDVLGWRVISTVRAMDGGLLTLRFVNGVEMQFSPAAHFRVIKRS